MKKNCCKRAWEGLILSTGALLSLLEHFASGNSSVQISAFQSGLILIGLRYMRGRATDVCLLCLAAFRHVASRQ